MKPKDVWFDGRINRREYFARANVCLLLILLALVPVFLRVVSVGRIVTPRCVPEELFPVPLIVIACMISFGYLLPAMVRRLHDFGRSGWWLFGLVVLNNLLMPMLGKGGVFIWKNAVNLLLLSWPGTKGPNEYGEVPRFEVRKLLGRRFAMVLVVMYALEAALCGWIITSADFAFSDIGLQLSVELKPVEGKKFDSLKRETLTGMVAKKSANDSYGDRALRLADGVVQ